MYNKTLYILNSLCNEKNKTILIKNEQDLLTGVQRKANKLFYGFVGSTVLSNYIYTKLARRLVTHNLKRKITDFAFIISMTYLLSNSHNYFLEQLNKDLVPLVDKYKYILKNSIGADGMFNQGLNKLYTIDNRYFYFILLLVLRIIFK
jgi:hypothetical protein